ncbi:MAG: hypothetical protein RL218_156 [Actinomycetota bacterium]
MTRLHAGGRLLDGKVAVVTGAGSGLGREYALALASEGASVVVNDFGVTVKGDRDATDCASDVVREIVAHGGRAIANRASVADWVGAESIIGDAVSHFGDLHIVVNNAGNNRPSSLVELSEEDVDTQIDVHLKGTLAVSHFAAKFWSESGVRAERAIVNTTSAAGLHPTLGAGVYGAAKAAVSALTLSHAQELARFGVRVNAIAPCARTRMVRESPFVLSLMPEAVGYDRHAPEHVAPLVVYLVSELSKFTGRVFAIEGPDVAIYRSFSVEKSWSTDEVWTPVALGEAFADVNERTDTQAFFPGGVVPHSVPPGRTLKELNSPQTK